VTGDKDDLLRHGNFEGIKVQRVGDFLRHGVRR
jgi:hypothetical protein